MGFFMMIAPYLFGYADNTTALWTSLISGLLVVAVSVGEAAEHDRANWEYWVAGIIGAFAIVAPFILNFGQHVTAMWTTIIVGAIITFLAGSRLWTGTSRKSY